ncbi:MAG: UbiA family prenyltransferase [Clostridia bacterium]|nr:UbiA family prenyltransferase [Clostridia bacterium]
MTNTPRSAVDREKVLDFLKRSETAVVATSAGDHLRLRMMHLGIQDDFTIYLASMRNDPKIIQMINHPSVSIMVSRIPEDVTEAEEVEYVGRAVMVRDPEERRRCLEATRRTSPIVASLIQAGNTDVLDCIKIVPRWIKYRKFREITQGVPPTVIEFPENHSPDSDWALLANKARNWWQAVRINSLTASLVPAVLGTALARYETGAFNPLWALVAVLGVLLLQAAANVFNDYHDHYSGNDPKNLEFIRPFSGGSRVIQLGLLTSLELLVGGGVMVLAAVAMGFWLALAGGRPLVVPLAIAGALSGIVYNRRGWNLIRMGLGEVVIGLNFGVLITVGAYYVQTGRLALSAVGASIPISLLIMSVIFINEFQDENADRTTDKTTWIVRLGRARAAQLFPVFFLLAYAWLLGGIAAGHAPAATALALLAAPLAAAAVTTAWKHYDHNIDLAPANGHTAIHHLIFGLFQALGYVAATLGRAGLLQTAVLGVLFVAFGVYMYRYTERLRRASLSIRQAVAR